MRDFNEKYLPPLIQEKRKNDFIRLRQGNLSVAEYETQFTRLSKFAPELVMTERKRVRRFVQGQNVEIQETLAAVQIDTFVEALEKSQRVESARVQVKIFQARKRNVSSGTSGQTIKSILPLKVGKGLVASTW